MPNNLGDSFDLALRLHRRAIVIDTHIDTTQRLMTDGWEFTRLNKDGHVDLPRLRMGGIDAAFFAIFASGPLPHGSGSAVARAQLQRLRRIGKQSPELQLARTAHEIITAKKDGKTALVLAIEGGYLIEDSLDLLHEYQDAGAVYLTLTHGFHTTWADSSGIHQALTPLHGGLTAFGREVILEMNRMGMIVDVSHVSDQTFWQVVELSTAPIMASHSSCRAVSPHRRNLSDEMMRAIASRGGVVQINFAAGFVDRSFPALDPQYIKQWRAKGGARNGPLTDHVTPLSILVDHFDHALQTIGPDHVGIGSDFDGVPALPVGMEDCSQLPALTMGLLQRGYSEDDLIKVLGGNVLRVMDACQGVPDKPCGVKPPALAEFRQSAND